MPVTSATPIPDTLLGHTGAEAGRVARFFSSVVRTQAMAFEMVRVPGGEVGVPRYGALGHLAAEVPLIVFDHPVLAERIQTMATDGLRIYINAAYGEKLMAADEAAGGRQQASLFAFLHELSHILRGHCTGRLAGAASVEVLNQVFDASINPQLLSSFRDVHPGTMASRFLATDPESVAQLHGLSEETIFRLWAEGNKRYQQVIQRMQTQGSLPQGHIVEGAAISRDLDEAGCTGLLAQLSLPSPNDSEGFTKASEDLERKLLGVADKVRADLARLDGATHRPRGAEIDQAFVERIRSQGTARVHWRIALRKPLAHLMGARPVVTDEHPDPVYYSPTRGTGLRAQPYLPGMAPTGRSANTLLVIVDSSNSMSGHTISDVYAELASLARSRHADEPRLVVYQADIDLRGDPMVITATEAARLGRDGITVTGRGNTDMSNCLKSLVRRHERDIARRAVAGVLYFTDLGDYPPAREIVPKGMPPTLFLCRRVDYSDSFAVGVAPWGKVVPIDERATVSL